MMAGLSGLLSRFGFSGRQPRISASVEGGRKLFLSYGWKDDQRFVKRLYRDLKKRGYDPWMDVHDMPSRGKPLPLEVIDQIGACERVIVILGRRWLQSEACQAEWAQAIEFGKVINPILRDKNLKFAELPADFKKFLAVNFQPTQGYKAALEELLRVLAEPAAPAGQLIGVPSFPSNHQLRSEDLQAVRDAMEIKDLKPVAILSAKHNVALQGMSGIGKTVLAIAYARNYEARRSFPDGIIWLTVRREPNLVRLFHLAGSALRIPLNQYTRVEDVKPHLQAALEDKACLLVLDDVWDLNHAQALLDTLGPRCRMLLTTRDGGLANKLAAHVWHVDRLKDEMARSLLAQAAGVTVDALPVEADDVIQECGNLPYPIAQCGATIKNGNPWRDLLEALRKADVSYFAERLPNYEYLDVFKSIQVSLDFLAKQDQTAAKRYLELAVFPAKQIPEAAAVTLWTRDGNITEPHARKLLTTLHNVALVERLEGQSPERLFSLHDLQVDYVRAVASNTREQHEALLRAYRPKCRDGWATGPNDGYFFHYLPFHLTEAGHERELRELLLDPEWSQAKLAATDVASLTADFDHQGNDEGVRLVQGAIRLSSNVIAKDPGQFASQMLGRLLSYGDMPAIEQFTKRVADGTRTPWLRPLQPTLHTPGTALVCTLAGHTSEVHGVAMSGDGRIAVSASYDKTLKVWEVVGSGRELRTLAGHTSEVNGVAMSGDGRIAVSASADHTLKVWEVESGRELRTLAGHTSEVNGVAMSGDGRIAVSASYDQTLKVWEVGSGRPLRTLAGHTHWVYGVAMSGDGRIAVSASSDSMLKVWEVGSGRELRTLAGHTNAVHGVAMSGDGRIAVSASYDKTLKVWEVESGRELRTLTGHTSWVNGVALSGNGRIAVSASYDKTLKVWEVESGRELRTLAGHTRWVRGVALSGDERIAVSASGEQTLKVWEVGGGRELRTLAAHTSSVLGVAMSGDGRIAVSASYDKTLKVWEVVGRGRELRTLAGHTSEVHGVAMSGDGRIVVSASADHTLKVWEVGSGLELRTLAGHTDSVRGVAVSGDGRIAVSASADHTLKVWEVGSGRPLRILAGHTHWVYGVALSGDGRIAVSASGDKMLVVWEVGSGRPLRILAGHTNAVHGVALSGDGRIAVSASADHTLKVWEVGSGRPLRILAGHTHWVYGVALSGDGRIAVSASADHTLKVWEVENGKCLATFTCDSVAYCCTFPEALNLIVAGDAGGNLHFLRLEDPNPKK